MSAIAFVFTGQGSQYVGMGSELAQTYPEARDVYAEAESICPGITELCFAGPAELLNETSHTQPAIYVTEIALWRAFMQRWPDQAKSAVCFAGHSLGEYAALTAAGALSFAEGLRLVMARGEAMRAAGQESPGGMLVVLGLTDEAAAETVKEAQAVGAQVWAANYNAPGQVVLAGSQAGLEQVQATASAKGAKRCIPLSVSVACHTPLMQQASDALNKALREAPFSVPREPIICNVDAQPHSEPGQIRDILLRQLTEPVRWVESVQAMRAIGMTDMVEIGPKAVLAGLVQRIDRAIPVQSVMDAASLDGLKWGA